MGAAALRSARMELKTTDAAKDLLSTAAALDGLDLTAFVLGPAMEKARMVISQYGSISLTLDGQAQLVELLRAPKPPTAALRDLMNLPDLAKA